MLLQIRFPYYFYNSPLNSSLCWNVNDLFLTFHLRFSRISFQIQGHLYWMRFWISPHKITSFSISINPVKHQNWVFFYGEVEIDHLYFTSQKWTSQFYVHRFLVHIKLIMFRQNHTMSIYVHHKLAVFGPHKLLFQGSQGSVCRVGAPQLRCSLQSTSRSVRWWLLVEVVTRFVPQHVALK